MRQSSLIREERYIRRQQGEPQMNDISEKLNRLEKTLLKRNQFCDKELPHNPFHNHKYKELNTINENLQKALTKLASSIGTNWQVIEARVVGLYNESVSVLTTQDKLIKKLSALKSEN